MTTTTKTTVFQQYLKRLDACTEAIKWAGERTAQGAWEQCERADWLLWWAAKARTDRKLIVKVACKCARLALRFVPDGENRPRIAIETAERWVDGNATLEEVRAAADAYAASYAADAASYAAYYAYYAAYYAAYAAADAADAAYAASYAASYAARAYAARATEHKKMCKIIREIIPMPEVQE